MKKHPIHPLSKKCEKVLTQPDRVLHLSQKVLMRGSFCIRNPK